MRSDCSLACSALGSGLMSYTTMVLSCPWRFSVTPSSCLPSSENSTLLIAVPNSHVFSSLPVLISHSLIVLSAPPVARRTVFGSQSMVQRAPWWPLYTPKRSPLADHHAQALWSLETEKMKSPSLLNLKCCQSCAAQAAEIFRNAHFT